MSNLLHELILDTAQRSPKSPALSQIEQQLSYEGLAEYVARCAHGFGELGLRDGQRVAVYLPKQIETVVAMFGTSRADAIIVPVNPVLKPEQVEHILMDCGATILVTSRDRAKRLSDVFARCKDLNHLVLVDGDHEDLNLESVNTWSWQTITKSTGAQHPTTNGNSAVAAILYTSGSTGKPKGVVLSHGNMVTGAKSVASYLNNTAEDRILAVLPFSFDYGFSQMTTGFLSGARVTLMDYLLPRDVIRAVEREKITALAGVPPLWIQLCGLDWPRSISEHLRYITNSGGAIPVAKVKTLQQKLPNTDIYLMYGLTEAFRSTYLPPEEVAKRPDSMGKAIPNAEVLVVRSDGTLCDNDEVGELVHRGPLVGLGYWKDKTKTAERFRPAPSQDESTAIPEIAVWSGDMVRRDEDGFLYFVGRNDEMIKTSGNRVSPGEIEEIIYSLGLVSEVVALGVAHDILGQSIAVVCTTNGSDTAGLEAKLLAQCKLRLPSYMVPSTVVWREDLPRNPNGKLDRSRIINEIRQKLSGN